MNSAKRFGFVLGGALLGCAGYAGFWNGYAKNLLLRSMRHAYNVNVTAMIEQRCPESGGLQLLKMEQCKSGASRYNVLSPGSSQGVVMVDDCDKEVTYIPLRRVVVVQESARKEGCDAEKRIAMAERNYALSLVPSKAIAGRPTVCVVAAPRSPGLYQRRYYLDAETAYLLRFETISAGRTTVEFDTRSISYPDQMAAPRLTCPDGMRIVASSRQALPSNLSGGARLGFKPTLAPRLSLGFSVQGARTILSKGCAAVVIRISDGLVQGAIYEWRPGPNDRAGHNVFADRTLIQAHGLNYLLVADIPAGARESLLRSLAQTAGPKSCFSPRVARAELPPAPKMFHRKDGQGATNSLSAGNRPTHFCKQMG